MILWTLFITFFQIGALAFGGGYSMLPMVREKVLTHGWLTEEEILNRIAVSESTPGPLAVNLATFIGSDQAGIPGAVLATLGVVLPSFLIILAIAALLRNFMQYKGVQAFLSGVRPCVIALILGTALTLFMSTLLGIDGGSVDADIKGLIILAILFLIGFAVKKRKGKQPSPIVMILISAVLGIVMYSF
ncbi:MAG: chromate transporter [Ruminococcaceae bacterium]|nr:chromate transporter [Oscillospiraceae bacterium]